MSYADSLSYVLTLVAIAVAPGPVVLMMMVRTASNDVRGATGFGVGFAAQLRKLEKSERSMAITNRALASLLVFGGGWIALGQIHTDYGC